jgi:hypothetical protein
LIEFIDENGVGAGGAAEKAATKKRVRGQLPLAKELPGIAEAPKVWA